jgi:hypothetical protein
MKQLIIKFIFLFYKYYDKGSTKDIAYESAILAFVGLTTLNLAAVFNFFDIDIFFFVKSDYPRYLKYLLCSVFYLLPAFFVVRKYYPKHVIAKYYMDKSTMRIGYFFIVLYLIISIAMLIISVEYK